MDAAIRKPPIRIMVHFDGPEEFHLTWHRRTSSAFVRASVSEACGWRFVSIPHFEWSGLREQGPSGVEQRRKDYLVRALLHVAPEL